MLGFLYRIFVGSFHTEPIYVCNHEWETIDTTQVYLPGGIKANDPPVSFVYHLRCKNCGDIKFKRLES